jgi:hypothetical protein
MKLKSNNTLIGEVGEIFARYYLRRRGFYPVLKPMFILGIGFRLLPSVSPTISRVLWECSGKLTQAQKKHIFTHSCWDYVAFGPGVWGKELHLFEVKTTTVRKRASREKLPTPEAIADAKASGFKPFLLNVFLSHGWETDIELKEL